MVNRYLPPDAHPIVSMRGSVAYASPPTGRIAAMHAAGVLRSSRYGKGVIAGRCVKAADGSPIPFAVVRLFDAALQTLVAATVADDDGLYAIEEVRMDAVYFLVASDPENAWNDAIASGVTPDRMPLMPWENR